MTGFSDSDDGERFRQSTLEGFGTDSPPRAPYSLENSDDDAPYGYGLFLALMSTAAKQLQLHRSGLAVLRHLGVPRSGAQEATRLHSTVLSLNSSFAPGGAPSALTVAAICAALNHLALPPVPMRFVRARGFAGQALTLSLDPPCREHFFILRRLVSSRLRRYGISLRSNGDPHVTLHYAPAIEIGDSAIPAFDWVPDRLVLVLSHLGRHRHDRLGEWGLDT